MGASDDPMAVVDSSGRLRGLDNVAIWDASILPRLPAAQPLLTVYAAAEHLAARWR
jgi:choline dehydrogenase-like flavoprotein